MVVSGIAGHPRSGVVQILEADIVPHFRLGVALGDEPGSDAHRYLAYCSLFELADVDTVELVFFGRDFDSDSQLPTRRRELHTSPGFPPLLLASANEVPVMIRPRL